MDYADLEGALHQAVDDVDSDDDEVADLGARTLAHGAVSLLTDIAQSLAQLAGRNE